MRGEHGVHLTPYPFLCLSFILRGLQGSQIPVKSAESLAGPILGDPGAVSWDDRMFMVKVYCNKTSSKLSPRTFYRPD